MTEDLPFDHPLRDGLPSCDPRHLLAYVPIPEDSGAECMAALLEKLTANRQDGVTATLLSSCVLEIAFVSVWVNGRITAVAGRRAVRLVRESWSPSTTDALIEATRSSGTRAGCGAGVAVSALLLLLLEAILSERGAPPGEVRIVTLFIPFLIPPLIGAAVGTVIGDRVAQGRALRATLGPPTLAEDAAARDAFVGRVVALAKEVSGRLEG